MPDDPKHIALVVVNLRPGFDGAATAMLELMPYVERLGYRVSVFNFLTDEPQHRALLAARRALKGAGPLADTGDVHRYREGEVDCQVHFLPFTTKQFGEKHTGIIKKITGTLREHPSDYFLTIDIYSALATYLVGRRGCHFFHSLANVKEISTMHPAYRNIFKSKDIATISQFLREKVKTVLALEATVLNPGINLESYVHSSPTAGRAIGFYAGGQPNYKGDEVVKVIIEKMPEKGFIIVGRSFAHDLATLPANVRYLGFQSDMRDFYRQVKVVLVPSLVSEGFSRVILEAAANGIPAIANNTGGIPEALQDSGILIDLDSPQGPDINQLAKRYVEELQRIFHNQDLYQQLRQQARRRARRFAADLTESLRAFLHRHLLT